jgi:quercetin 2,3-dioxygenase
MGDLVTYRALPTRSIDYIDPFLFLNHHGPQVYGPNNRGLPFGPHPHRGMETVTFIIEGDIVHLDNTGHQSVMKAGGVQWMTAGSGLIHSEVSSDEFKKKGGPLEILQLWVNLPASLKMTEPFYKGLNKEEIPRVVEENGQVTINVIAGKWGETSGAFDSHIGVNMFTVILKKGGLFKRTIPAKHNVFFYVVRGAVTVNGTAAGKLSLVEFEDDGEQVEVVAEQDSLLILGHAIPLNEPVVFGGPFVMNTAEQIEQAYADYQSGKFGSWNG